VNSDIRDQLLPTLEAAKSLQERAKELERSSNGRFEKLVADTSHLCKTPDPKGFGAGTVWRCNHCRLKWVLREHQVDGMIWTNS